MLPIIQKMLFPELTETTPRPERLGMLAVQARACQRCKLRAGCRQVVFGAGNINGPLICFVGEAPGEVEDRTGVPFKGKAGEQLDKMIVAMKLQRENLYITNVVLCQPPFNREPQPDEMQACREWVEGMIHAVAPKCIVALGGTAGNYFSQDPKKDQTVASLRGNWHTWHGFDVRVTYHPAGLLRNPELKRAAWEDLQEVMLKLHTS